MSQRVSILGATGSIGQSTLGVIALHPDDFEVFALTANVNVDALFELCLKWKPIYAVLKDADAASLLSERLSHSDLDTQLLVGEDGLCQVASDSRVDVVVAAIVGAAGLKSSFAAAESSKKILLANKESLVMSGHLFMQAVRDNQATLLPIDSEHNAIFQSLPLTYECGQPTQSVSKILLTASGGPFLHRDLATFDAITPEDACAHPNWTMGKKISVDSATMMNKGLEFIEACFLFACDAAHIEVIIHPQSIVHSMVAYVDGSVLAQMGQPDMSIPIAHALAWPQRFDSGVASLDFMKLADLSFEAVDVERFPCLQLAIDALSQGQSACIALNAANEVAVDAFLRREIQFLDIATIVRHVLANVDSPEPTCIDDIIRIDELARKSAQQALRAS
ncbi:MAG: 1-deoxy-D-xylulose-5-phosphate reductoisomerase [Pseudomonadota bacterium]